MEPEKRTKIRFFLRGDGAWQKIVLCLLWVGLSALLGGLHLLKALYMGAYLTRAVIIFYTGAFLITSCIFVVMLLMHRFCMDETACRYRGKCYDKEKCGYKLQENRLALYRTDSDNTDSIVLEYKKVLEIQVPRYILPKVTELLKSHYTEAPVGAGEGDTLKKSIYMPWIISGIVAALLVGVVVNRGYLVNEWELYRVPQGLEVRGYNGNKSEIIIPAQVEGLDVIGIRRFNCNTERQKERIESIRVPESVTTISELSFVGLPSLKSLSLPAGVNIRESFVGCRALREINLRGEASREKMYELLRRFEKIDLYLSDCEAIGDEAFCEMNNLETLRLDDSVHSIGTRAFADCASLQGVSCGSGLNSIGDRAFSGCGALWNIEMAEGVSAIGDSAFADCTSLEEIVLPESLEILGNAAFADSGLRNITVYGNVTDLPQDAFHGCSSLEYAVLGSSMESIGDSAFSGCVNLQKIALPEELKSIGDSAFYSCMSLSQIELPEHVKVIGDSAFNLCVSIKELELPDSVEEIGALAFAGVDMETLQIPEGCVRIESQTFIDCKNLQTVRLPDHLESIGESAFKNCPLKSVFLPDDLTQLGEDAFLDINTMIPTVLCYTEDCAAREQIENTYFDKTNGRNFYALYMVESRSEYEELEKAGKLEDALLMLSADEMIEIYHLSPAEISVENTEWEGYHSENRMFVPDTVAGMTATLRFRDDHVGALYIQMDANTMNREFDWQKDSEYGLVLSVHNTDETYETYFYTDDEGVEYLRVNMNGMDEWFLKAQE